MLQWPTTRSNISLILRIGKRSTKKKFYPHKHRTLVRDQTSAVWNIRNISNLLSFYYTLLLHCDFTQSYNVYQHNFNQSEYFLHEITDLVRHLKENKKYIFRVVAFTLTGSSASSEEVIHTLLPRDKQRAIVAGLVGGILFFIVAIILSVCAVKICNRRKRRKQEKGQDRPYKKRYFSSSITLQLKLILCTIYVGFAAYNMVACRLTDARNGGQIPTQPQVAPKRYP